MLEPLVPFPTAESRPQLTTGCVNHDPIGLSAKTRNSEQPASEITQRHWDSPLPSTLAVAHPNPWTQALLEILWAT